ncbi:MAG: TIGR03905 family TSCPD domain-containing protein [Clostridiales bacterium]|nr:TIGR03905 family TSCPD domain-containing protein [Clostridiales bacterium]
MENHTFQTRGVCARMISFGIEDGKLHDVRFFGGCPGNTAAIGKLIEGKDAREVADLLRGNDCGGRGTSCADQLAIAIDQALKDKA